MRKSRSSDQKIVAILREADRASVAEAAKKHEVSEQTVYVWRKHFACISPADGI
jgi:putative transposase